MPLHPSAPEGLPGLVDAYTQTMQAVLDLGHGCSDEDFALPTDCTGWTVKDHLSHVVGTELGMTDAAPPDIEVPDYPWLRSDVARFHERAVEARRPLPGRDVVHELERVVEHRLATLQRDDVTLDDEVPTPFGPDRLGDILPVRVIDIWTHEQDLRHALTRPGNLDSPGAALFVATVFGLLPRTVARDAEVGPGHVVLLDVTGPVVGRAGARVELVDGRPRGIPLFSGHGHEPVPDEDVTSISLSTDALCRRAAGRGGVDDVHVSVTGDEAIARRVLEALPFTP